MGDLKVKVVVREMENTCSAGGVGVLARDEVEGWTTGPRAKETSKRRRTPLYVNSTK